MSLNKATSVPVTVMNQLHECKRTALKDCGSAKCPVWKYLNGTCAELNEYQYKTPEGLWKLNNDIAKAARQVAINFLTKKEETLPRRREVNSTKLTTDNENIDSDLDIDFQGMGKLNMEAEEE